MRDTGLTWDDMDRERRAMDGKAPGNDGRRPRRLGPRKLVPRDFAPLPIVGERIAARPTTSRPTAPRLALRGSGREAKR